MLVSDVGVVSTADVQFVDATDLTTLKPSEAIAVTKVLVSDVGVESTADLQFVEATDLTTLKPSEAIAVAKELVSDVGVESTADLQFHQTEGNSSEEAHSKLEMYRYVTTISYLSANH